MENIIYASAMMSRIRSQEQYQIVTNWNGTQRLVRIPSSAPEPLISSTNINSPLIRSIMRREALSSPFPPQFNLQNNSEDEDNDTYERYFTGDIRKPTKKEERMCCILHEPIEKDDLFHECLGCKAGISVEGMRGWWKECKEREKTVTCPCCRKEWNGRGLFCEQSD